MSVERIRDPLMIHVSAIQLSGVTIESCSRYHAANSRASWWLPSSRRHRAK
jgi:hypothetical protein